jgi:hypothetical protein
MINVIDHDLIGMISDDWNINRIILIISNQCNQWSKMINVKC